MIVFVDNFECIVKFFVCVGIVFCCEVECMIEVGCVCVNGKVLDILVFKVIGKEKIEVDGNFVEEKVFICLWCYYKFMGLVMMYCDLEGCEIVFDKLLKDFGWVIFVGCFDLMFEGLLLLINDGELVCVLELFFIVWMWCYKVCVYGWVDDVVVEKLCKGVIVEGIKYGLMEVDIECEIGYNIWFNIGICEGKNCEVCKVFDLVGLCVNCLIWIVYGFF